MPRPSMETRLVEMDELRVKKRKSVTELSIQMDLVKSVVNYKEKTDKRQKTPQLYDKKPMIPKNDMSSPNNNTKTSFLPTFSPSPRGGSVAFFLPVDQHESDSDEEETKPPISARSTRSYPVTVPLYERRIHSARSSRDRKFANFC